MARRNRRQNDRTVTEVHLRECGCGDLPPAYVAETAWRTRAVLALARHIRGTRDGSALPVLADALEEAGCHDEFLLKHCREAAGHRNGCWVVDLMLRGR
jgi:hypothetical protein